MDTNTNDDLLTVKMITLKNTVTPKADKTYVDSILGSLHLSDTNIDLKDKYIIVNSKQQNFTDLASHYNNLVSSNDVKDIFISKKETSPMETSLDLNGYTIYNVKDPLESDQAVNKKCIDKIKK